MNKSYTTLKQGIELSKTLPSETADLWYPYLSNPFGNGRYSSPIQHKPVANTKKAVPCWTVNALLTLIDEDFRLEKTMLDQSGCFTYSIVFPDHRTSEHEHIIDAAIEAVRHHCSQYQTDDDRIEALLKLKPETEMTEQETKAYRQGVLFGATQMSKWKNEERRDDGRHSQDKTKLILNGDNFPDANFRAALSEEFGINEGDEITDEMAAITVLDVRSKSIADLTGIEHFTALIELSCYGNELTSLDVSKNTALQHLYCWDNQLTSLDVSKNTALKTLSCGSNKLTSLDVSENTELTSLNCRENKLTSINLPQPNKIISLNCSGNTPLSIYTTPHKSTTHH